MRMMILAGSPLLKEVIGWDRRGGWPGSDHGDLISLLDAIEGDASHMPTNRAFNCCCCSVELSSVSVF